MVICCRCTELHLKVLRCEDVFCWGIEVLPKELRLGAAASASICHLPDGSAGIIPSSLLHLPGSAVPAAAWCHVG